MNQEKIQRVVAKLYSGGNSKGRKLKPGNKLTLCKLIARQIDASDVATLGVFQKLPLDIAKKIHDKALWKTLTPKEYSVIAHTIIANLKSKDAIVSISPEGVVALENMKRGEIGRFKVRSVFNTQERQLILG